MQILLLSFPRMMELLTQMPQLGLYAYSYLLKNLRFRCVYQIWHMTAHKSVLYSLYFRGFSLCLYPHYYVHASDVHHYHNAGALLSAHQHF